MYYGGFLWHETLHLPVPYKRWFVDRIVKEINKSNGKDGGDDGGGGQSRALHQNSPDVRQMQGRFRSQVPSRLRRFT